ncbi:uncharacterized protein CTRU02_213282 [Colletotrichum truncatum]|uniref:Uncharacterized protein n=1 Tax=Colletotrichum truncatum TaxID=5467 RepID=A0ACC3YK98_COLTU|nr:uncharacterized protein CTRU02_12662 [Colletotrichum truncatum]KAF6784400.1 hypothetical protein CTRU02_12662 [Colletotrichum truncatum]
MTSTGPTAATVIATDFTLIAIAAALIIARLYLRLSIQKLSLKTSDYLICAAWIFSVANASFNIVFYKLGASYPDVTVALEGFDPHDAELIYKLQWAALFPFYSSFYLSKATLLTLYSHFFPAFMKTRRKILWATMAYCAAAYITTVAVNCLICKPIEGNW